MVSLFQCITDTVRTGWRFIVLLLLLMTLALGGSRCLRHPSCCMSTKTADFGWWLRMLTPSH